MGGDSVYLKVAAGSVENLKPDLVMEAFCQFIGIEPDSVKFQHHRLEMYTDRSEDGSLIPLEPMGVDMTGDEEETDETKSFDREKRKSCVDLFSGRGSDC